MLDSVTKIPTVKAGFKLANFTFRVKHVVYDTTCTVLDNAENKLFVTNFIIGKPSRLAAGRLEMN